MLQKNRANILFITVLLWTGLFGMYGGIREWCCLPEPYPEKTMTDYAPLQGPDYDDDESNGI